jgi:hypothetical protein
LEKIQSHLFILYNHPTPHLLITDDLREITDIGASRFFQNFSVEGNPKSLEISDTRIALFADWMSSTIGVLIK